MKIKDKKVELDIVKTILLKSKEPNEKIKILIKLEKTNKKLSKRILTVKEETSFIRLFLFFLILLKLIICTLS